MFLRMVVNTDPVFRALIFQAAVCFPTYSASEKFVSGELHVV